MATLRREIAVKQSPEQAWDYLRSGQHLSLLAGVVDVAAVADRIEITRRQRVGLVGTGTASFSLDLEVSDRPWRIGFTTVRCRSNCRGEVLIESGRRGTVLVFELEYEFPGMAGVAGPDTAIAEGKLLKDLEEYFSNLQWTMEYLVERPTI